jgi:hypothetical protein
LFSVTFLSLFLGSLFAKKYKEEKSANYKFKRNANVWLITCILMLLIAAGLILSSDDFAILFSYIICSCIIIAPLYSKGDLIMDRAHVFKIKWRLQGWNYAYSFTFLALTRLLITSGIPVMFFYITSFNYEQNLDIRYKQLQFGKALINRIKVGELDTAGKNLSSHAIYTDGTWIKDVDVAGRGAVDSLRPWYSMEDNRALIILNTSRVLLNNKAVVNNEMYAPGSADASSFHNNLFRLRNDTGTITLIKTKTPGKYLRISSQNINYHFPEKPLEAISFWLMLLLALVIFFITLKTIIVKLFAINMPDLSQCRFLIIPF